MSPAKRTVVNPILPIFSQNIWNLWFLNRIVVVNEGACFIFQKFPSFISENDARNSTGRSSRASSLDRLVGSLQLPSYSNLTDRKRSATIKFCICGCFVFVLFCLQFANLKNKEKKVRVQKFSSQSDERPTSFNFNIQRFGYNPIPQMGFPGMQEST